MIGKIETYDGKVFELTEEQYENALKQIDTAKFMFFNGNVISVSSIKELYRDYELEHQRENEKLEMEKLPVGQVAGFLKSGNPFNGNSEEIRIKLKKIWTDHIQRRPEIDRKMAPLRLKVYQDWNDNLPLTHPLKNRKPMFLNPVYS